jgi:hypothetical protein
MNNSMLLKDIQMNSSTYSEITPKNKDFKEHIQREEIRKEIIVEKEKEIPIDEKKSVLIEEVKVDNKEDDYEEDYYDFLGDDDIKAIREDEVVDKHETEDANIIFSDREVVGELINEQINTNNRREEQLNRIKSLKNAVNLEEENEYIMYEIDYYNKRNEAIEKIAKGIYKHANIQTSEKQSTLSQTNNM